MIRAIIENAIRAMEAEKAQTLTALKDRVLREKIVPKHNEIDGARDKAIAELAAARDREISEIQATFALQRQELMEAGEKKKADFASETIAIETSIVTAKYDTSLAKLREQLEHTEE